MFLNILLKVFSGLKYNIAVKIS